MDPEVKSALEQEWNTRQRELIKGRVDQVELVKVDFIAALKERRVELKQEAQASRAGKPLLQRLAEASGFALPDNWFEQKKIDQAIKALTSRNPDATWDRQRTFTDRVLWSQVLAIRDLQTGVGVNGERRDEWVAAQARDRVTVDGLQAAAVKNAEVLPADIVSAGTLDRAKRVKGYVRSLTDPKENLDFFAIEGFASKEAQVRLNNADIEKLRSPASEKIELEPVNHTVELKDVNLDVVALMDSLRENWVTTQQKMIDLRASNRIATKLENSELERDFSLRQAKTDVHLYSVAVYTQGLHRPLSDRVREFFGFTRSSEKWSSEENIYQQVKAALKDAEEQVKRLSDEVSIASHVATLIENDQMATNAELKQLDSPEGRQRREEYVLREVRRPGATQSLWDEVRSAGFNGEEIPSFAQDNRVLLETYKSAVDLIWGQLQVDAYSSGEDINGEECKRFQERVAEANVLLSAIPLDRVTGGQEAIVQYLTKKSDSDFLPNSPAGLNLGGRESSYLPENVLEILRAETPGAKVDYWAKELTEAANNNRRPLSGSEFKQVVSSIESCSRGASIEKAKAREVAALLAKAHGPSGENLFRDPELRSAYKAALAPDSTARPKPESPANPSRTDVVADKGSDISGKPSKPMRMR
ncbi:MULTISPECIES: hypothetical protein [unclassified Pseudomonas]|uniref:hypothetical protein n=1 Tax=unclassified Pseudomonas TaxID=196821 RepID=UPI0012FD17AB|nr:MULTISPECIES: hypothetical protein [unclassified Pseudomonas]MCU1737543.1 hypothetical protein [Pseudomonas sp. 20S_6.2_Bac1]